MKRLFYILSFIMTAACLCACPYSSVYQIDDEPSVYVDDALLGKWAASVKKPNSSREEPVKLILGRRSDMEYDITFIGFLDELRPFHVVTSDSIKGTAFLSDVGGRKFFNIRIHAQIYIAELRMKEDKLSLLPLAEHFTAKMIRSNYILRNSVDIHYKTRVHPLLDEDFCLYNMTRVN